MEALGESQDQVNTVGGRVASVGVGAVGKIKMVWMSPHITGVKFYSAGGKCCKVPLKF